MFLTRVLRHHWPDSQIFSDVRTMGLGSKIPPIDILCGGFPCQDISIAGSGDGIEGKRSGLFFELTRIAELTQPRFIVLENVAALRSRGLDRVLLELARIGYNAEWHTLSAADVGASHQRKRWFCIAWRQELGNPYCEPGERGGQLANTNKTPKPTQRGKCAGISSSNPSGSVEPGASKGNARRNGSTEGKRQAGSLANTDREGLERHSRNESSTARWAHKNRSIAHENIQLAYTCRQRCGPDGEQKQSRIEGAQRNDSDRLCQSRSKRMDFPPGPADLLAWRRVPTQDQPSFCRVANGVPSGVGHWKNCLMALGNAVVPQCAQVIGLRLLEIDDQLRRNRKD